MMGIETMLSNMIGIKPDQMAAIFNGLVATANEAAESVKRIEAKQDEILQLLKGADNERTDNDS